MENQAFELLRDSLDRIETKVDGTSERITKIEAKVYNGLSHNVAETHEDVKELRLDFARHIEEEAQMIARHFSRNDDETAAEISVFWKYKGSFATAIGGIAVAGWWLVEHSAHIAQILGN